MKSEPRHEALVPVSVATLERLDALIEHLMELRNLLAGEPDQESEHPAGASWRGRSSDEVAVTYAMSHRADYLGVRSVTCAWSFAASVSVAGVLVSFPANGLPWPGARSPL